MSSRVSIILEALFLLVLPVALFTFRILPLLWRYWIMEAALLIIIILIIKRRITLKELGLRRDNFILSIKAFLPGTLLIASVLIVVYFIKGRPDIWWNTVFFVYYFLIGVISQQFAFQGYLSRRLQRIINSKVLIIVIVGLMFSLLHTYRLQPEISVATFILGMYWTWTYLKQPNIYAVSLSHGIIGTTAILLGFV
ncbi:CPBP family intramembrane glutamic endopeptidase [Patescibacteria group bacterium]